MKNLFLLCRIICCCGFILGGVYGCDSDGGGTTPAPEPQASFTALPFSNDELWECWVNGMSPDGQRLAGACLDVNGEVEAVLWINGELIDLGHMGPPEPPLSRTSFATGSADNDVVIGGEGYANLTPTAYYYNDGTWTQIINPTTGKVAMEATGISSDGTVIIGNTNDVIDNQGDEEQFEGGYSWDRTTGDYVLATSSFFADICDSYANCHIFFWSLTADGKAIVGSDTYSTEGSSIFSSFMDSMCMDKSCEVLAPLAELSAEDKLIPVYYELSGHVPPVRLPLPGNYPKGVAQGISRNGSFIVGAALGNLMPTIAVYWDRNMAVHIIGSLGPDTDYHDTLAYDVTDDGSTIVGRSNGQAFIFTTTDGMMTLEDYLKKIGLGDALTDWELLTARAISPDGHYIAGTGLYRDHYPRGYLVYIP